MIAQHIHTAAVGLKTMNLSIKFTVTLLQHIHTAAVGLKTLNLSIKFTVTLLQKSCN